LRQSGAKPGAVYDAPLKSYSQLTPSKFDLENSAIDPK